MSNLDQRGRYTWIDSSTLGLLAFLVVTVASTVALVSLFRNYPDSQALAPLIFGIGWVLMAVGLLLLLTQFEISMKDSGLQWRRSTLLNRMLRRAWVERRIPRRQISGFRLNRNPWTEPTLSILLNDGSILRVRKRRHDQEFESFLAAFRSFAELDPDYPIEEDRNV